jgi:hypothetical protein
MSELFRFMVARPAQTTKDLPITIAPELSGLTLAEISQKIGTISCVPNPSSGLDTNYGAKMLHLLKRCRSPYQKPPTLPAP